MDITGETYGRLTVTAAAGANAHGRRLWRCVCICGKELVTTGTRLRVGVTSSCGCIRSEARSTHGLSKSLVYTSWISMMNRCYNFSRGDFLYYGGSGITVCKRWHSFENFIADMPPRTDMAQTLERRNNSKGYGPKNCYWTDRKTQARNRRNSVLLAHAGVTQTVAAWAEQKKIPYSTLSWRSQQGWSDEEIINGRNGGH